MCGRLSLFAPPEVVTDRFDAEPTRPLEPRYNVAPGQAHPVVRDDAPDEIRFPEWGLVPQWADGGSNSGHVNARSETLAEKPSFREAFAERRCLVLADGFYDWKETPTGKQPYRIEREDSAPLAFAGLWEPATNDGGDTFTVVTTEPNSVVEEVHHRMPVILDSEAEERRWLRGAESDTGDPAERLAEDFADLLDSYPAEQMHAYPVSDSVNDPENDTPEIIEEVPAEEDVQTGLGEF